MVRILLADQSFSPLSPTGYLLPAEFQELRYQIIPVSTGFLSFDINIDEPTWKSWMYNNHFVLDYLSSTVNVDMFFSTRGDYVPFQTVDAMRAKGIKTLNWDGEDPFPDWMRDKIGMAAPPTYWEKMRHYHIVAGVNVLMNPWEPMTVYGRIFHELNVEKKYNIGFVGKQTSQRRAKWLEKFKPLGLEIRNNISWEELNQFYAECKIVINLLQSSTINARCFEATASGTMLLTDYVPGLDKCFDIGSEVVVYEGDGVEEVKYYLEHDEERERIARAGLERTKKQHRLRDTLARMVKVAMECDDRVAYRRWDDL